jgi:hypothetical protein
MEMFPNDQLARMALLTCKVLEENKKRPTTAGGVLKVIGILILGTRFEFGKRHELWSATGRNRLLDGTNFRAKPGMSRNRFDDLWSCMRLVKSRIRMASLQYRKDGISLMTSSRL